MNQLQSRIINIGLEFKPVPLFTNYKGYAALIENTNQRCSFPYEQVKGLVKDDILEIISYGFDGEKTKVILA
jgi:hypothetical protein